MSGMFPTDEQCLSFNLPFSEDAEWLTQRVKKSVTRGLLWAIFISLLVHLFFLPWFFSLYESKPTVYTSKPQPIHVRINYSHPAQSLAAEAPLAKLPDTTPPPEPQVNTLDARVSAEALFAPIRDEPVDAGKLHNLIQQKEIYRDADLSVGSSAEPPGTARPSRHFNDVFHPGLRAKLQNNAMHRSEAKYQAGGESSDIYGSSFVDTGNGSCLMAVSEGSGAETDWYHTRCQGYKDEGEEIMGRVNNAIRQWR